MVCEEIFIAFLREEGGSAAGGRRMRDKTFGTPMLPLSLRDIPLPEGDEAFEHVYRKGHT